MLGVMAVLTSVSRSQPPMPTPTPGTVPGRGTGLPTLPSLAAEGKPAVAERPNALPTPQGRLTQPVVAGADGVHLWNGPVLQPDQAGDRNGSTPLRAVPPASPATAPGILHHPQRSSASPEVPPPPTPLPLAQPAGPPPPKGPASAPVSITPLAPPGSGNVPVTPSAIRGAEQPEATLPSGKENSSSLSGSLPPVEQRPAPTAPFSFTRGEPSGAALVSPHLRLQVITPPHVVVGMECRCEVRLHNGGTSSLSHVVVEDEIPEEVNYIGSDPPAQVQGRKLRWEVGTLEAGSEKHLVIRLVPSREGSLRLRPVAFFAAGVEKVLQVTRPRVQLQLSGPQQCRVGDEVTWTIQLHNSGSGPAHNLLVQAQLSEGLRHPQGATIEAHIPLLGAGESKTLPLRVTAVAPGTHFCRLIAVATAHEHVTTQSAIRIVEPRLELRLNGPPKCLVRGEAIYEIVLSNPGTAETEPLTLYIHLPPWLDLIQAGEGGTYQPDQRYVIWHLAPLAAGASRSVGIKVRATAVGEGTLRGVVQTTPPAVQGGAVAPASVSRMLQARSELAVRAEGVPALRFDVFDVEDPVLVGQEAVYEIRLVNQGTGPCQQIHLVAVLPEGAEYKGSSGPTAIRQEDNRLIFAPLASLPVRGEAVYRLRIRGTLPGDARLRVHLSYDQMRTPVIKEESTQFIQP